MREQSSHSPVLSELAPAGAEADPADIAVSLLLRLARKLHRAATSGSVSSALPALRRVHAAGVFPGQKLSALYAQRQQLKRKHFLRVLAVEAGFPTWERFRPQLARWRSEDLARFRVSDGGVLDERFGSLNLWFSTEDEARAYALQHGGQVIKRGTQAMVVSAEVQPASQQAALAGSRHDA